MSDDLLNDLWCDGSVLSARAFDEIERLEAERDKLCAELAAERERQNNLAEWVVLLCDELEAVLGGEYADQHGPLFEIVQSLRARIDRALKGDGDD